MKLYYFEDKIINLEKRLIIKYNSTEERDKEYNKILLILKGEENAINK